MAGRGIFQRRDTPDLRQLPVERARQRQALFDVRIIRPGNAFLLFGALLTLRNRLGRTQIPLLPAWAITIHKSQGMTLDRVIVDLYNSFEREMCYVVRINPSSPWMRIR